MLVTGGAGFIGSNLCEVLLQQNNQVVCLDNFSTGKQWNIAPFISNPSFSIIEGDIRNYEDCRRAVSDCQYVLHQAALGSVPRSISDPVSSTDVNIGGFVKVLHAAAEAGVKRLVYAASSSAYGDHPELPKKEHKTGKALSPYGLTKYVDELFAENFSSVYGIETIGLRYFNVFGKGQDPAGAYAAVIPKFILQLIRHESPTIYGDGSFSRDFTHIDNVILANQLAATADTRLLMNRQKEYYASLPDFPAGAVNQSTLNEVFNVASGENISLSQLAELLKSYLSEFDPQIAKLEIGYGPTRRGDIPHSLASVEKSGLLLGYYPVVKISEGLKQVCEWYWKNYR